MRFVLDKPDEKNLVLLEKLNMLTTNRKKKEEKRK
jgi:hypothetical protein